MDEAAVDIGTQILRTRHKKDPGNFDPHEELRNLKNPVNNRDFTEEEIEEIENRLLDYIGYTREHETARIVPIATVDDPREHEEWYIDWFAKNDHNYHWERLENYLQDRLTSKYGPERAARIVKSIDESTHKIMEQLADPRRQEFEYKGVVVGYVQSGKTANFTALISKAADASYKFIIVLAGIHNILRNQTQVRLDKELTGINDLGLDEAFIEEPSGVKRWTRLTTAESEFRAENQDPFQYHCGRSTPTIAVIKKNCKVLERLIEYIESSDKESRGQMPVLVIDDEADQASINTSANEEDVDPTRTNKLIRRLLTLFPRNAYVGYTATPFANVLIDMEAEHHELGYGLYPRNFIAALPEPENYFGANKVFSGDLSETFVKELPDNEREELLDDARLTEGLQRSIDDFLVSCATRNLRDDREKPMSMLVHVSHRIHAMGTVKELVDEYLELTHSGFRDATGRETLKNRYEEVWKEFEEGSQAVNEDLGMDNDLPEFDAVWSELEEVLGVVKAVELNSESEDELDYTRREEIKVIAIGGNQLSRGLTLEGLMTSYYLRPSRQYDTLLQMARWFGFREGYEDLTRVHSTAEIWEFFEHLSLVEEELRGEIYRYEEEGLTPAEMAVAIRDHKSMNVTSRNKLGRARRRQTSLSKSTSQTFLFPLDQPDVLQSNYRAGEDFIEKIQEQPSTFKREGGSYLKRNIDGEFVLENFLEEYEFAGTAAGSGPRLDAENLLSYIRRRLDDGELQNWNIAVIGKENSTSGCDPIEYGGLEINRINRSRKYTKHTEYGYNIGVLTDPKHLRIDLDEDAEDQYDGRDKDTPLLLLYLIWKDSKAKKQVEEPELNERVDLFRDVDTESVDVLGFGLVLPESQYEPHHYMGQQI